MKQVNNEAELIKTDAANDLLNLVPAEVFDLLPGFIERRSLEIHDLQRQLNNQDFDSIRIVGHKLKGVGASYGFPLLSEFGNELESAASLKNPVQIKNTIVKLSTVIDKIQYALKLKKIH